MIKAKKIILSTLGLYFLSVALLVIFPHMITAGLFALFTTALPFILIFLLAFSSGVIEATKKIGWLNLFWLACPYVYYLFAHKWAVDKVNELFGLDPALFRITTSVLAAVFPISLYSSSIWQKAHAYFLVYGSLLILLVVPLLFFPDFWNRRKKQIVITLFILCFMPIYMGLNSFLAWRFNNFIEPFALWADFNDKHRCQNLSAEGVSKVIFLGGDKVVAYYPYKTGQNRYEVRDCIYSIKP